MQAKNLLIKLLLLCFLILLSPLSFAKAQSVWIGYGGIGSNGDWEAMDVDFPNNSNWDVETNADFALFIGGAFQYYLIPEIALHTGINIIRRSNSYEIFDDSQTSDAEYTLSTVSLAVPVTLRLETRNFYIGLGGYGAWVAKASWSDDKSGSSSNGVSMDGDIEDKYYNKFDYGYVLELGLVIDGDAELGLRYDHGIPDVIKTPVERVRTRSLFLSMGIRFNGSSLDKFQKPYQPKITKKDKPSTEHKKLNKSNYWSLYFAIGSDSASESLDEYYPGAETEDSGSLHLSLGFLYHYKLASYLGLKTGLTLNRYSYSYEVFPDGYGSNADREITVSMTSVMIPLTIRLEGFFYVGAGMYSNYIINASRKDSKTTTIQLSDNQIKNQMDFGFILEAGFSLFDDKVELGIRYEQGLSDIIDTSNEVIQNVSLFFTLGIRFL